MKRLVMISLISLAAITNFGLTPKASATCNLTLRIDYLDCNTGMWCGYHEFYCDGSEPSAGCETQCKRIYHAYCICE